MRVAALQIEASQSGVLHNLKAITDAALKARERGAELLVAPELAVTGYGDKNAIRRHAEAPGGELTEMLAAAADFAEIAILAGFAERAGDALYNSAALAVPGRDLLTYRKCHLYGPYERELFAPGQDLPQVIDIGGLKVGILICYDVEFPEAVRRLALDGVELIAVPTALPECEHAAFIAEKLVPVRAFENGIAIVYANHVGVDARFSYAGRSCIVMPDGQDAARAGPSEAELIVADYVPADYAETRAQNPYLIDRRADLF